VNGLTAEQWNERYPIGTPVRCWPGFREGEGMVTRTRTPAWTLGCGAAVVSVDGKSGGIALTHVELLNTEHVTEIGSDATIKAASWSCSCGASPASRPNATRKARTGARSSDHLDHRP
jgi:hypothetical protein